MVTNCHIGHCWVCLLSYNAFNRDITPPRHCDITTILLYLMFSSDSLCHGISVSYCDKLVNFVLCGEKQLRGFLNRVRKL